MIKENKRIKNATEVEYNNIQFKSIFEKDCYIILKESGIDFEYESKKIVLFSGFYPNDSLKIYDIFKPRLKKRIFGLNTRKILDITYTPDFFIKKDNTEIYIEAKGLANDVYPLKKKLFLNYLRQQSEITGNTSLFFEVHSKKQLKEAIIIIQSL